MEVLKVRGLCKRYERFELKDVSFSLRPGTITGFIGRNGAGKTTTLKSLLHFVHPDEGEILFWGKRFEENETAIKQDMGFVSGGIDYYPKKKLKVITSVNRRFYPTWDEEAYRGYMRDFALEEEKTPDQLSEGMKVKYALTLALSHRAKLLILDEPTSGLDPVSRDDLLDVFMRLVEREGVTILFSTHITSDLDKCADDIVYIKNGVIEADETLDAFSAKYRVARLTKEQAEGGRAGEWIGLRRDRHGYTALVEADRLPIAGVEAVPADLETIMIHLEKE